MGPISMRRRARILGASAIAGLAAFAAMPGLAMARTASFRTGCGSALLREIEGTTLNRTQVTLRSVYREEGWGSSWGPEPAKEIGPGFGDRWCNRSNPFPFTTAAMKIEYALNDGDKVVIESFVAFFGSSGATCLVVGPNPSAFKCDATSERLPNLLRAKFTITP